MDRTASLLLPPAHPATSLSWQCSRTGSKGCLALPLVSFRARVCTSWYVRLLAFFLQNASVVWVVGSGSWPGKQLQGFLPTKSCPALCKPMDCSLPPSSDHGIFQARILEWVAICFSRGSSSARDGSRISCVAGRLLTH